MALRRPLEGMRLCNPEGGAVRLPLKYITDLKSANCLSNPLYYHLILKDDDQYKIIESQIIHRHVPQALHAQTPKPSAPSPYA